jgi:hypothetical protein
MATGKISREIEQFIHEKINSVEQLEVLLLLSGSPEKEWSAAEVSQKLYIQPESATKRLADLHAGELLILSQTSDSLYRYKPSTNALESAVSGLAEAYKVRRVSVINLIFSKPHDHIRVFSDAFRIRKED